MPSRRALAAGLLLAIGLVGAVREGEILSQRFFRTPSARILAEAAVATAPAPGRLAWFGNFYPQVPPRHVFDIRDEYYYVYHLGPHVLEYYLGRPVLRLDGMSGTLVDGALYPVGAAALLRTGDALLQSVPEVTVTANLDTLPPPLQAAPVQAWDLFAAPGAAPGLLQAAGDPVSLRAEGRRLVLEAFPGPTEVLVRQRSGLSASLGVVPVRQGRELLDLPSGWAAGDLHSARVVRYRPRPLPRPW
jgi:hypothetical protein